MKPSIKALTSVLLVAISTSGILPIASASAALTPARDLVGIWQSSLNGKGFTLSGSITNSNVNSTVTTSGDVRLVISSVSNNVARGKITYSNMKERVTIRVVIPGAPATTRVTTVALPTSTVPIAIGISSSRLVFPSFRMSGILVKMTGGFTTDIMSISETMTANIQGLNVSMKGEYHLSRAH